MNGTIVGAAIVSHHPGLMQCEEFRRLQGAGEDSDLIAGYARLREKIQASQPDVILILDSHWFTTGYHLVDGGARYSGSYISDEMPWYLHGVPYDYRGLPGLALEIEAVSRERGGFNRAICHPDLGRQYATINLVKQLRLEHSDIPVVTASSCQNCEWPAFVQSGEVIGEAIRRSGLRVVMLGSGALSHKFNNIDWKPRHPRIFHEATCPARRTSPATRAPSTSSSEAVTTAFSSAGMTSTVACPGKRSAPITCRWSAPWVAPPAVPGGAAVGIRERPGHRKHPHLVRHREPGSR
ncbi:MAG: hypothetical protein R3E48_00880 [Burkholderiaceae bacterium]